MSNTLINLPAPIRAQCMDWRIRVAESCPLLNAPLRYSECHDVPIECVPLESSSIKTSFLDLKTGTIHIFYDNDLVEFNRIISHEGKHRRQLDVYPAWSAWLVLDSKIEQSLKTGVYCLDQEYILPSVMSMATIRSVSEVDAHAYAQGVQWESKSAFITRRSSSVAITQELIDGTHRILMEGPDELEWIRGDLANAVNLAVRLMWLREKFGVLPAIRWQTASLDDLRSMVIPFWKESGYVSPFCVGEGAGDIEKICRIANSNSLCGEAAEQLQSVLDGQIPPALAPYRAQFLSLGLG